MSRVASELLPQNATEASLRRAELAVKLAQACPEHLAHEIALVGSTAHGYADDESDLELNLWGASIPPLDDRIAWLQAAGASEIRAEASPRPDNSYWISFQLEGIAGEVGWQTYAALRRALDVIPASALGDRKRLVFADVLVSALPLRTSGRLAAWQARLDSYGDAVQRAIIEAAVGRWATTETTARAARLARRGEQITLMGMLLDELDMALRVLYAAHRRWEPSRKWTLTLAQTFAADGLLPRIDAVLGDPLLERRVDLCARFCLDMLELVPAEYDVSAAVAALQAGLTDE